MAVVATMLTGHVQINVVRRQRDMAAEKIVTYSHCPITSFIVSCLFAFDSLFGTQVM
jgi:hypothetical protein